MLKGESSIMKNEVNSILLAESEKNNIIDELLPILGISSCPNFLKNKLFLFLDSGVWVVSQDFYDKMAQLNVNFTNTKKIRYCGIFLGKFRKIFGLSLESLYFLKDDTKRFVILKGKTLQKFLYGKKVEIKIKSDSLGNLDFTKVIVKNPDLEPVGIGSFSILETGSEEGSFLILSIEPVVDLGFYLRKEEQIFR